MQKTFNRLFIIFAAFLFSSFVYLIVGFTLSRSHWRPVFGSTNTQQIIFWILILMAISDLVVLAKIHQSVFEDEMEPDENAGDLQHRIVSRSIVLYALAEVPAILGLIHFMLSGSFFQLMVLCLISLVAFVVVRPSQQFFDDLDRRFPPSGT